MAEAGADLLAKIFDIVSRHEHRFDQLDASIERLDRRIDRSNDTLTIIGSVVHKAVDVARCRVESKS